MDIYLSPFQLKNNNQELVLPPSKSILQRACALAVMRKGITELVNIGNAQDNTTALNILKSIGLQITLKENDRVIIDNTKPIIRTERRIDVGESGLSLRMFPPLLSHHASSLYIIGRGSLLNRPIKESLDIWAGLSIKNMNQSDHLPLLLSGTMVPQDITIKKTDTSQILTGLLLAFTMNKGNHQIVVEEPVSTPYINLTLSMLQDFGFNPPQHQQHQIYLFKDAPVPDYTHNLSYTIEGDWSAAAFFIVLGAIRGNIQIKGLNKLSYQADKSIVQVLDQCGVVYDFNHQKHNMRFFEPKNSYPAFNFDATHCPDLFPPLVAFASIAKGTTIIKGVHRLTHKESARALTLQQEFTKLGVPIILDNDDMIIEGVTSLREQAVINAHHDHRIVMACATTFLLFNMDKPLKIIDAHAIDKSFPDFFIKLKNVTSVSSV
ncbi:MAG: hypothetical protein QM528_05425 [Phycisphaerales bacterium]|nr:hypothetical protein [Phycisphaerales bacterium]